ncbi:MAG: hypothetical protein ACWA49_09730 [Ruegeria sp.]
MATSEVLGAQPVVHLTSGVITGSTEAVIATRMSLPRWQNWRS